VLFPCMCRFSALLVVPDNISMAAKVLEFKAAPDGQTIQAATKFMKTAPCTKTLSANYKSMEGLRSRTGAIIEASRIMDVDTEILCNATINDGFSLKTLAYLNLAFVACYFPWCDHLP
jgi:hypothetical protein